MKDILKTEQLEFENSAYLLDLIKHTNHTFSVDMIQTIHNNQECGTKDFCPSICVNRNHKDFAELSSRYSKTNWRFSCAPFRYRKSTYSN